MRRRRNRAKKRASVSGVGRQNSNLNVIRTLILIIVVESLFLFASCHKKDVLPLRQTKPKAEGSQRAGKKRAEKSDVQKRDVSKKEDAKDSAVKKKAAANEEEKPKAKEPEAVKGRIAIVLDDWGYSLNNLGLLEQINEPLTLAILPNRAYSADIAIAAQEHSKEAILHLPLEPHKSRKYGLEPDTIMVGMEQNEISRIMEAGFKSVPGLKGVSNHMGSLATENRDLMKMVLTQLKKNKLYFLDSYTGRSVVRELARPLGVGYARRQVFLDNEDSHEYIMAQIEALAKIANQRGSAIGIGHDRRNTLEALVEAVPDLKKRGYGFIYVSELTRAFQ